MTMDLLHDLARTLIELGLGAGAWRLALKHDLRLDELEETDQAHETRIVALEKAA